MAAPFWKKFTEYATVSDTGESYTSRQDPGSNGPYLVTKAGVTYVYFLTASRADLRFKMIRTSNGASFAEMDSASAPPWTTMSPTSSNPALWSADFGANGDGDPVAYLAFTDGDVIFGSTIDWKLYHSEAPDYEPFLRFDDDGQLVARVIKIKTWRFDFLTDTWHALADAPVTCINFETGIQGFTPNSPGVRGLLIRISPNNGTAVLYHGSWPTIANIANLAPYDGGAGYVHDYLQNTLGTSTYTEGSGWGSFVDMTPSPGAFGQENYWVQAYNDSGTNYGVIAIQVNTFRDTSHVNCLGRPSTDIQFPTVGFSVTIKPPNIDPSFYGPNCQIMSGFISRMKRKQASGTHRLFFAFINPSSQLNLVDALHNISVSIPVTVGVDNFNVGASPGSTNSYGATLQTFLLRGQVAVTWFNFWKEYLGSGINNSNPNCRFMIIDGADATFSFASLGDMFEIDLSAAVILSNGLPNQISELGMFGSPWNCKATPIESMWQFRLFWLENVPEPRAVCVVSVRPRFAEFIKVRSGR